MADVHTAIDERALSRLKWRCRRGLLENDLFIADFFARHKSTLSVRQAQGLEWLMQLPDNDLLDLLLRRCELPDEVQGSEAGEVLMSMRRPLPKTCCEGSTP